MVIYRHIPKNVDIKNTSPVVKQSPGFAFWANGGIVHQNGNLVH